MTVGTMSYRQAEAAAATSATSAHCSMAVEGLSVAYRNTLALEDVSLQLPVGRLIAIVGPNGAGKSTLLKSALGLVRPLAGRVQFFGRALSRCRKEIGYVPQRESVDWDFPTTVLDVVAMGLYGRLGWLRFLRRAHRREALECLEKLGIADLRDRQISQLSGGQQQRVFLARALAQRPRLFLMDEPFAGVDATTEHAVMLLLQTLRAEGNTVIAVHHDLQSVESYFDHVVMLARSVVASGPISTTLTAENIKETYGGRPLALESTAE
jgi:manganese/zinc/iron transport system ATP- binding protein